MLISMPTAISVEVPDEDPDPQATAQAVIKTALAADERIRLVEADRTDILIER